VSHHRTSLLVPAAAGLTLLFACSDAHVNTASGGAGGAHTTGSLATTTSTGGGTTTTGTGTGTGGTGGIALPTSTAPCQGHIYACGDLLDNDGDGLVDSQDPDCLGPCDNTEDSLFGGIPGQAGPPCKVDCYFDQDSGPGNDDCYWTHECDPFEVSPGYHPEAINGATCSYAGPTHVVPPTGKTCAELDTAQSAACHAYCGPLTSNGCDCFGCCNLPAGSSNFVWLGSTGPNGTSVCTLDKVNDPSVCEPCTPVTDCMNPCDPCEICIGKPTPDPGCSGGSTGSGGGGAQCPGSQTPCGLPGQPACPSGQFCNTGCCVAVPA
jgi:hypothetical protein